MEGLEIVVKGDAPAIVAGLTILEERLESLVLQVVAHEARLRQADDPARRLDPRDGVQALAHPERAIWTMANRVHELVGISHAEPGHQDLSLVCLPVAIGVGELDQTIEITNEDRRVADVVSQWFDTLDHRQAFSETDSLVGLAVAIGVLEAEDIVARLHARHGLGIGRRTADIKAALGVP